MSFINNYNIHYSFHINVMYYRLSRHQTEDFISSDHISFRVTFCVTVKIQVSLHLSSIKMSSITSRKICSTHSISPVTVHPFSQISGALTIGFTAIFQILRGSNDKSYYFILLCVFFIKHISSQFIDTPTFCISIQGAYICLNLLKSGTRQLPCCTQLLNGS